ncbi:hypothetical protein ABKV19_019998 [Rosa sericea]
MVPSDFSSLPKTPIPSSQIPAKSHQSPQLMLVKRCRLTPQRRIFLCSAIRASNASAAAESSSSSSPGLYSAKQFELTVPNIDLVLEDVGPYLINDGGNVDFVSVEDGVVSLKLQGACGSCPSSTTTMKMGIKRVLKEKFGDALRIFNKSLMKKTERPQLRGFGVFFSFLGMVFFFDKGLLAMGNSSGDFGTNVKRLEVETEEKINHLSTEGSRISGDIVSSLRSTCKASLLFTHVKFPDYKSGKAKSETGSPADETEFEKLEEKAFNLRKISVHFCSNLKVGWFLALHGLMQHLSVLRSREGPGWTIHECIYECQDIKVSSYLLWNFI